MKAAFAPLVFPSPNQLGTQVITGKGVFGEMIVAEYCEEAHKLIEVLLLLKHALGNH